MNSEQNSLLHDIDKRLAVIEDRVKDVPEIRARLERLTTKVATVSAIIGFGASIAAQFLLK